MLAFCKYTVSVALGTDYGCTKDVVFFVSLYVVYIIVASVSWSVRESVFRARVRAGCVVDATRRFRLKIWCRAIG